MYRIRQSMKRKTALMLFFFSFTLNTAATKTKIIFEFAMQYNCFLISRSWKIKFELKMNIESVPSSFETFYEKLRKWLRQNANPILIYHDIFVFVGKLAVKSDDISILDIISVTLATDDHADPSQLHDIGYFKILSQARCKMRSKACILGIILS